MGPTTAVLIGRPMSRRIDNAFHRPVILIFIRVMGAGMNISDVCRTVQGSVEIDVSVSPRSNRPGPDGYDEWRRRLILRVSAPPLDGRANKEVCQYFSELTGCRAEVSAGQTSRQKTVRIPGDPAGIMAKLGEIDGRRREARRHPGCIGEAPGAVGGPRALGGRLEGRRCSARIGERGRPTAGARSSSRTGTAGAGPWPRR